VVAGERALVTGALEWLSDRGALQLRASEIIPVGEGAVAAMLAETRRRLAGDGLLERARRRVPILPGAIGVVCGADAAVRQDIESVVAARFPGYPLVVHETAVSGPGAATAIAEGVRLVVRHPGVDVVILARGGGDATQLLPWSDEGVCRAVAACPVPVVSAIGHESDRPLCDEVADLRCGTPSLAAAATVPDRGVLEDRLDRLADQCRREVDRCSEVAIRRLGTVDTVGALRRGAGAASERLVRGRRRLDELHPGRELIGARRRLAAIDWRRPAGERLGRATGRWEAEGRHLRALSPDAVLARGYAVVRRADGTVVRSAAQVTAGDRVDVRVARGGLRAVVEETSGD
jgi:exodeoxyribonuclease VII large subunit